MIKILIDTDIGDDIDDALALAVAVKCRKLELVGVTCVYRNTALRARQAKKVLSLCGKPKVPVYAGWGKPIVELCDEKEIFCQYTDDLQFSAYDYDNPREDTRGEAAIDFILDTVRRHGSSLVLLAIGPLTNVARAIQNDPATMRSVGRIVLMGGDYTNHFAEWNIVCDPESARIVFESGLPLYAVGHDFTSRLVLGEEDISRILAPSSDPLCRYLSEITRMWIAESGRNPVLHDPLAVQAVVNPNCFTFVRTPVKVETRGEYTRGMTVSALDAGAPPEDCHIYVTRAIDEPAFRQWFLDAVFPSPADVAGEFLAVGK